MKRAMVKSAREMRSLVRVGGLNPKSVWWDDQVKVAIKRKEGAWKEVLGAREKDARERRLEAFKEEKRKVKRCIHQSKEEAQEQFGRKMNQNVNGNRKLF